MGSRKSLPSRPREDMPRGAGTIGRACAVSSAKVDETSEDGVFKIEGERWLPRL